MQIRVKQSISYSEIKTKLASLWVIEIKACSRSHQDGSTQAWGWSWPEGFSVVLVGAGEACFRRCKTQKTKGHWNHRKKFEYLKKEKTFLYMEALEQQLLSLEYWETSFSGIASRLNMMLWRHMHHWLYFHICPP